ncbi:MAG: glycosyltransferase family 9 protein, partial [Nitrospinae bacterium]|nr:glycosyltransferase family 9 protein [Nitrospinota bacterium]
MVEKILILNMTRMGDLIQSTPLLAGLRKRHPSARITVVVSSDFFEFAKRIPHVDEIVVFNLRQFNEWKDKNSLSWVEVYRYLEKFLDDLAAGRFDLLVNLSHSKLSALMISYLGVKEVRGFSCHETGDRKTNHPWMQYFGTEPFNRAFNTYNLVDIFARGGDVVPDGRVKIVSEPGDGALIADTLARENIRDGDCLSGIQAGSSLEGRRWPASSFAELADLLA